MGRIIGLIGCTCVIVALMRVANLQHEDRSILGPVQAKAQAETRAPRELFKRGREMYLRGRYEEALPLLEAALTSTDGLLAGEQRQATELMRRSRERLTGQVTGQVTTRGQSPFDEPVAESAASALPPDMQDVARTRVERLVAQSTAAAKRGEKAQAIQFASQAARIAQDARLKFGPKEINPAVLLSRLQPSAPAIDPAFAEEGIQQASANGPVQGVRQVSASAADDPFGDAASSHTPAAGGGLGTPKEHATAMIRSAREDLKAGRFEAARLKAMEAEELKVTYDLFDDRPELVLADVDRLAGTVTVMKSPAAGVTPASATEMAPAANPKQQALTLVAEAREELAKGNLEAARAKAQAAQQFDVVFKLFEDRPELVLADLDAVQASDSIARQQPAPTAATPTLAQAKQLLAKARQQLEQGQVDAARQLAVEADQLQAEYGPFDDRPEIVLADVARSAGRSVPVGPGSGSGSNAPAVSSARMQAVMLLREARELITEGQPEAARAKVKEAEELDVAYGVLDDRPDLILAELDRNAARNVAAAPPAAQPEFVQTASTNQGADPFAAQAVQAAGNGAMLADSEFAPVGVPAAELFNKGMYELNQGNRTAAYQAFVAAHRSGERLDFVRQQRLQDYLRELAPRRNQVQTVNHQLAQVDGVEGEADINADGMMDASMTTDAEYNSDLGSPDSSAPSVLDVATQQETVKYDRIRNDVLNSVFKAERLREKDPEKSLDIIDQAMASVEGAELTPEATATLMKTLQRTRAGLETTVQEQRPNIEQARANEEVKSDIERDLQNKIRIEQEFSKLVEEFNDLMEQQRFAEAEVVAKKAKELNPREPVSETMFWKARFSRRIAGNEKLKLDKEESFFEQLNDVEKAAIVGVGDDNPMVWGDNWKEISQRRLGKYRADNRVRSPEEERIQQSLSKQISLHEDATPMREVIQKIATVADINVYLDEVGLEDEGASTDAPVTISIDNVSVKSALNLVLERYNLAYVVQDEVLKITSRLRQQGELEVRTYPVADLVVPIPNFTQTNAIPFNGTSSGGQMSVPAMPSGGGFPQIGPNFHGEGGIAGDGTRTATAPPPADFDSLSQLITMTIAPTSWMENGGTATVRPYETTLSLVVRQTQKVHEEIADLLDQLRRLQDLQVTVEVRFVTVTDRFFERIGIDFDFNLQDTAGNPETDNAGLPLPTFGSVSLPQQGQLGTAGTAGAAGAQAGQAGTAGDATGGFFTPGPTRELTNRDRYSGGGTIAGLSQPGVFSDDLDVPFRQGSFDIGVPDFGGFNPNAGVQIGLAILSDIEAFFFIQAAQGDERSNLMFAPKLTLFNGQTATVTDSVSRPFVTSLRPTVGVFAAGFEPQITVINDGVFLQVTAVISADRRYVRLTLLPIFNNLTDVFTFSFTGGATQAGATGGAGGALGAQGVGGGAQGGFGGGQFGIGGGMGNSLFAQTMFGQVNQAGTTGATGTVGATGNQAVTTQTVQQPVVESVIVTTTVSVPDGGTVLLGGVKRLREGRNMAGVPILNKIPYVSRLFKNSGVGRETESLMLMVTPRILINEEEEQLLGIPAE